MEQTWPNFCCDGYDFIVFECDSSGYGYGICANPRCPHGDETQAFQLDWYDDDEMEEDEFIDDLVHQVITNQFRTGEITQ